VVHERWQRTAAGAGALAGLALACWLLLSAPEPSAGPPEPSGTTATAPVVDWCEPGGEAFATTIDGLVLAPGWPRAGADAEAAADLAASWSTLLTVGAEQGAWRSARSVPSPLERAEVVRQLQVVRDALAEAVASGRPGAVRAEARALDRLLRRWC
jgi:hypothetical protein